MFYLSQVQTDLTSLQEIYVQTTYTLHMNTICVCVLCIEYAQIKS